MKAIIAPMLRPAWWWVLVRLLLLRKLAWRVVDWRRDDANLRVNIGGGCYFRRHWRVLDFPSGWYRFLPGVIDYGHDLTSPAAFPFLDNSVEFFFSSHTLEHLPQETCQHVLTESFRCLKSGGVIRLTMPDYDLAVRAYRDSDMGFFRHNEGATIDERFLDFFATYWVGRGLAAELRERFQSMSPEALADFYTLAVPRASQPNSPGNHINWWTFAKLETMLQKAGFVDIIRSAPQTSRVLEMRGSGRYGRHTGFDCTHPDISVFVEAVKP